MDKILINIPTHLKKELQIIAIKQDTNMTEIIIPLIQQYVDNYNKNEKS